MIKSLFLQMVTGNGSTEKGSVTFFALHLYVTRLSPVPGKVINDQAAILSLLSKVVAAPVRNGQGDDLSQDTLHQVRLEMAQMEQRLTAHIDQHFEHLKKEMRAQMEQLLLTRGAPTLLPH